MNVNEEASGTRAALLRARSATAPETIHAEIARGFIRCVVIRWSDLVEAGSRAEVVRRGQQRLEGKDYPVEDGDVLNIRFNVSRRLTPALGASAAATAAAVAVAIAGSHRAAPFID